MSSNYEAHSLRPVADPSGNSARPRGDAHSDAARHKSGLWSGVAVVIGGAIGAPLAVAHSGGGRGSTGG